MWCLTSRESLKVLVTDSVGRLSGRKEASAIIICDRKSLVYAISKANSADMSVIQLQVAAAVLAMSKPIVIVWAPGHCGMPGNELADRQSKLRAAETQADKSLDATTRRVLIYRFFHPLSNTSF